MKTFTKYWFLENFDFMKKIEKTNLMKIADSLEMVYLNKGDLIDYSEEPSQLVVFLKKGAVKIINKDTKVVKYIVGSENVFGELGFDEDTDVFPSNEVAICLEDSIICSVSKDLMIDFIEKHPLLKNSILKIQSLKINKLEKRLADLLYKSSEERIEEFIFSFVNKYGKKIQGKITVKNTLTHSDIAHLTNTSRQTVNNVISKMRKEGKIDYSRKEITI